MNMRRAAALLQQDGVGAFQPLVRTALAEAKARNGETEAALAMLERALEVFARTGQRWFDAEIHRARGEILLKQNPSDGRAIESRERERGAQFKAASFLPTRDRDGGEEGVFGGPGVEHTLSDSRSSPRPTLGA